MQIALGMLEQILFWWKIYTSVLKFTMEYLGCFFPPAPPPRTSEVIDLCHGKISKYYSIVVHIYYVCLFLSEIKFKSLQNRECSMNLHYQKGWCKQIRLPDLYEEFNQFFYRTGKNKEFLGYFFQSLNYSKNLKLKQEHFSNS